MPACLPLSFLTNAVVKAALATSVLGLTLFVGRTTAAPINEFLDFNNNQIPAGWSLAFTNVGQNGGVINQRFEADQVDTSASLFKNVQIPVGTNSIQFSYTANAADDFYGMGNAFQVFDANGNQIYIGGPSHGGYGDPGVRMAIAYSPASGPGTSYLQNVSPSNWGTYQVSGVLQNGKVTLSAIQQGTSIPIFSGTVAVPQLQLSQISKIGISAFVTSGDPAWIDNISITSSSPPPPQKIILDFNDPAPFNVVSVDNPFTHATVFAHVVPGTMPTSTYSTAGQIAVLNEVRAIFARSGVNNVDIELGNATPNATIVYFSDKSTSLAGYTVGGIDRFIHQLSHQVVVFPDSDPIDDAASAAHEVGHALGLTHVDPGVYTDPSGNKYTEVMAPTTDHPPGTLFEFINQVSTCTDPISRVLGVTHNPNYYLKRYVDGESDLVLQSEGIVPGKWDTSSLNADIVEKLGFAASARTLYNVDVWSGFGSADTMYSVAHFDQIDLANFNALTFNLQSGAALSLTAASTSNGIIDTMLAIGDPTAPNNIFLPVGLGEISAQLQMVNNSGYSTISEVTVTAVPEPNAVVIVVMGSILLLIKRRSK